jgi:hypothetical protein
VDVGPEKPDLVVHPADVEFRRFPVSAHVFPVDQQQVYFVRFQELPRQVYQSLLFQ